MARELEELDVPRVNPEAPPARAGGRVVTNRKYCKPASRAEQALRTFHEEGAIGKAYDGRLLRRMWPFVRPHARFVVASLITLVFIAAINLARPLILGDVVRRAGASDAKGLFRDGLALAGLLVVLHIEDVAMVRLQLSGESVMEFLHTPQEYRIQPIKFISTEKKQVL